MKYLMLNSGCGADRYVQCIGRSKGDPLLLTTLNDRTKFDTFYLKTFSEVSMLGHGNDEADWH